MDALLGNVVSQRQVGVQLTTNAKRRGPVHGPRQPEEEKVRTDLRFSTF